MTDAEKLKAFTDELDALNERTQAWQAKHGLKDGDFAIRTPGQDPEADQLAVDWDNFETRRQASQQSEVEELDAPKALGIKFRLLDDETNEVIDTTEEVSLEAGADWCASHPAADAPWRLEYMRGGSWTLFWRSGGVRPV